MRLVVPFLLVASAAPAQAMTLAELLATADAQNVDARIAAAQSERAAAEFNQAWSGLLPALLVQGTWSNNEFATEIGINPNAPKIVITPENQLDAVLRVELPVIDTGRWFRTAAASAADDAALFREALTRDNVRRQVSTTYYGYAAALAVREAARRSLAFAEAQEHDQEVRAQAGAVTELELLRARAEAQRNHQVVADTETLVANTRRALRTLTSVDVGEDAALPPDNLESAFALAELEQRVEGLPAVQAADKDAIAAGRLSTAAHLAIVPIITATFTERLTNAAGLLGKERSYVAGLGLLWPINAPEFFAMSAQSANAEIADLAAERQRLASRDQIHGDWQRLRAAIEKVKAATSQVEAARKATSAAKERYTVGAATQIDVIQAERDAFSAEVGQVQARTELASSQVSLRLSAGLPLDLK